MDCPSLIPIVKAQTVAFRKDLDNALDDTQADQ